MKKFIITIISITIFLTSCVKKEDFQKVEILQLKNNTQYLVAMALVKTDDKSILSQYILQPFETKLVDTVSYDMVYSNNSYEKMNITGESVLDKTALWNLNSTISNIFDFQSFKASPYQTYENCSDTSSTTTLCNFTTIDSSSIDKTENSLEIKYETKTYYFTKQQLMFADSI